MLRSFFCLRGWPGYVYGLLLVAANCQAFLNPINPGPDPYMLWFRGAYYLTTTQGDSIRMWKSPTVAGLKTARPAEVWRDSEPSRSTGIWAPEFHFISNRWYMYYTATSKDHLDSNHRMHVLESAAQDPLGPYSYKGRLFNAANDQYAIDGTVFEQSPGNWFFVWAARPGHVLTISAMANPWTLTGKATVIPADGFGCEEVREGPAILQRNGKIFLIYSACDTGKPDYKLGMLIAAQESNLLEASAWKQYPRAVFERNDAEGVFGPGHNGFFKSADGKEDWIVYHAKTRSNYTYRGRTSRAQPFTWDQSGNPVFGKPLPLSQEIAEPGR